MEVSFRVSTAQYARLLDDAGALLRAPVQVTLDVAGIDLQATGTISRASVEAGEAQTGRLVFARLDGARGFKPGDFVTVKVQEPELQDVIRLPSSALGADDTVLVLGEETGWKRSASRCCAVRVTRFWCAVTGWKAARWSRRVRLCWGPGLP